jgi:hypothetical protein
MSYVQVSDEDRRWAANAHDHETVYRGPFGRLFVWIDLSIETIKEQSPVQNMLLVLAFFFVGALGNILLEDETVTVMVRGGTACAAPKDLLDQEHQRCRTEDKLALAYLQGETWASCSPSSMVCHRNRACSRASISRSICPRTAVVSVLSAHCFCVRGPGLGTLSTSARANPSLLCLLTQGGRLLQSMQDEQGRFWYPVTDKHKVNRFYRFVCECGRAGLLGLSLDACGTTGQTECLLEASSRHCAWCGMAGCARNVNDIMLRCNCSTCKAVCARGSDTYRADILSCHHGVCDGGMCQVCRDSAQIPGCVGRVCAGVDKLRLRGHAVLVVRFWRWS